MEKGGHLCEEQHEGDSASAGGFSAEFQNLQKMLHEDQEHLKQ